MISEKALIVGGGLAIGAALAYVAGKGVKDTTAAAVGVVGDVAAGVVIGAGEVVGVPNTDTDKCRQAMRLGNTMDASLYCPATTFLKYLVTGQPVE